MKTNTIFLTRISSTPNQGTFGLIMFGDGKTMCSLEPLTPVIPQGSYTVSLTYSPKFKRALPLVNGVFGHSGIRIHCGNSISDTQGCILVGLRHNNGFLYHSKLALCQLLKNVQFPAILVVK